MAERPDETASLTGFAEVERRPKRARSAKARSDPTSREYVVSKKTKKRKLRARRNKANHGKRPNVGRR
jgi:hypothetical protein